MRLFLIFCLMFYSCLPAFSAEAKLDESTNFNPQLLKLQIQTTTPFSQKDKEQNQEKSPMPELNQLKTEEIKAEVQPPKTLKGKIWKVVKGTPMDDSIMLGMQSYHTSNRHDFNEKNNLVGIEYRGYTFNTLKNSFNDQSYLAGVSRQIWQKHVCKNLDVNLQYKAGLLYGYKDRYPNIGGITPLALPFVGVTVMKKIGVDLLFVPGTTPIFAANFRLGIPKFKSKQAQTKTQL
jgi:hypothetical protein